MKKAKIVIADNEDGKGWFIYRVDYVTDEGDFTDDLDMIVGNGIKIERYVSKE